MIMITSEVRIPFEFPSTSTGSRSIVKKHKARSVLRNPLGLKFSCDACVLIKALALLLV